MQTHISVAVVAFVGLLWSSHLCAQEVSFICAGGGGIVASFLFQGGRS